MAICDFCQGDMTIGVPCVVEAWTIDGVQFPARLYGTEHEGLPMSCDDCRAPLGAPHHPGCHVERCPKCGDQAISCGHSATVATKEN